MVSLCVHFGTCGGCALQDLPADDYLALKHARVVDALARQGLGDATVEDVHAVAPGTRRRAVFKVKKTNGAVAIGFHAVRAHTIVDMRECHVITPAMASLVPGLRDAMTALLHEGEDAELHITEADNGFDLALRWRQKPAPSVVAEFARRAPALRIARVTAGKDVLFADERPRVRLGPATVTLPADSFLQPTRHGEAVLIERVRAIVGKAKLVADLFAGLGTFSLPLAQGSRIHAVEMDAGALTALIGAARTTAGLKPVTTEQRDLFKRPMTVRELENYDAVVLDPPRAGAAAQAKELARSTVRRIAYVSCDAQSFARDAKTLTGGGLRMGAILPVDQFLWSEHIELVASFERARA